jgi:transcriptional regulator with XRE-family HTH domain
MEAATMSEAGTLGDRLHQARLSRNYTRDNLADLAEVTVRTIERYESGAIARPQEAILIRIAKVLRVNAAWLIIGAGPMNLP